jgi:hypothetical protein
MTRFTGICVKRWVNITYLNELQWQMSLNDLYKWLTTGNENLCWRLRKDMNSSWLLNGCDPLKIWLFRTLRWLYIFSHFINEKQLISCFKLITHSDVTGFYSFNLISKIRILVPHFIVSQFESSVQVLCLVLH